MYKGMYAVHIPISFESVVHCNGNDLYSLLLRITLFYKSSRILQTPCSYFCLMLVLVLMLKVKNSSLFSFFIFRAFHVFLVYVYIFGLWSEIRPNVQAIVRVESVMVCLCACVNASPCACAVSWAVAAAMMKYNGML